MSVVARRPVEASRSQYATRPEAPGDQADLLELAGALGSRCDDVAEMLAEMLESLGHRDAAGADSQKETAVRRLTLEVTSALASYLATGDPTPPEKVRRWTNQSSAPFHRVLPLSDLTKLTLGWVQAVAAVIEEEASCLGTGPVALSHALEVARQGCDATLVTMARHFDAELGRMRSELTAEQARLAHQDLHDALTGLPNRVLLLDRLSHALASSERRESAVVVFFVDIDQFKAVNDVAGHAAGDNLLVEVSRRFSELIRPSDTLAHLAGDEFVLLCEDMASPQAEATAVARRILDSLAEPFSIAGREMFASASIGIAVGAPGDDPESLISRADAAMYLAKQRGRSRFELYEPAIEERRARRAELANELHRALERDELEIHYQPVKRVSSQSVVTMEALLRWHHGRLGQIGPAEFVPIAEETGLIVEIGRWVLDTACRDCGAWRKDDKQVGVSINLSARQLNDPHLVDDVRATIERSGLPPAAVTLELTESILVTSDGGSRSTLEELKALGVRLAIDDFGTGYSSLSYLAELPVDDLKIDRSFVSRLGRDSQSLPMIGAVVELAHALGLCVVAEGVETEVELEEVRRAGCDEAQGYLLGKPRPLAASPAGTAGTEPGTDPARLPG